MLRFFLAFLALFVFWGTAPAHAITLNSGSTVTGSVIPGGSDTYTFSGTAGQGFQISGYSSNYNVSIKIYKPDNTLLVNALRRYDGTLPSSGTYTVVIGASAPSESGAYTLYYVRGADSVSNGALISGTTVSATLDYYQIYSYTISATAGQGVFLHAYSSSNISISLYRPNGTPLVNYSNRVEQTLPDTGTYTVVVAYSPNGVTGNFKLYYAQGGGSVSDGILASGSTVTKTLENNQLASYQITASAGQGIMIYGNAAQNVSIRVYNPDGSLFSTATNRFSETLLNTGTYTVVVSYSVVNANGTYKLYYVRGASSVSEGTLISTSARSGVVPPTGLKSYRLSGVSGNNLSISTSGSLPTKRLTLYRPDGTPWTTASNSLSATLPATGTYTLVVYGNSPSATGSYTVTATTTPAPGSASDPEKSGAEDLNSCAIGNAPANTVGNPINFDLGYKVQTERDYASGTLFLTRIYRSDSTWTDNTFGARWRHNYARTLSVSGSAAAIIDGTGAKTEYTLSGGNWVANDSSITATFETLGGGGYAYTLPDNTREVYNTSSKLVRIEYLGGGAANLSYNGSGQLASVTDENGRSLTFSYTSGRISSVVTPEGTFDYGYSPSANLIEVEKPDSATREYHYEDTNFPSALTGITDENGVRYATYAYDTEGRAILSSHAGDVDSYSVTYNADGSTTTTNPLGKSTTYYFMTINGLRKIVQVDGHASANCVASNRYYNYDTNGWLMSKTDWEGNTTTYARDSRGRVTQTIEAAGTAAERITTTAYEAGLNLPETVTLSNRQTAYTYDAHGRMTSMTLKDLATDEERETAYTYYANTVDPNGNTVLGRIDTITAPNGAVTKYTYNANLLVQTVTEAYGQTYAQTTSYTYDAAKRIAAITTPNGAVTALTYDSLGRMLTSTRANGTALAATTTFAYDDNGNVTQMEMPNGLSLSYSYDNAGRLIGIEDDAGNTISYTLDDAGNITQTQYKDPSAVLKYTQNQVFDELSRLIKTVNAASDESLYAYDKNSNLTSYTDANSHAAAYSYDALQRLIRETNALGGETDYAYTAQDDTSSVTDPRDNETTYVYNAFGDLIEEDSPDRGYSSYEYDSAGNITTYNNASGISASYTYDLLNRVTAVSYPLDTGNNISYTYDSCTNGMGLLCGTTDASGTSSYEYDLLGRLTETEETRGTLTFTTGYAYDLGGILTGITLPSGRVVTYGIGASGQVASAAAPVAGTTVTLAGSAVYLPFGPLTGFTYGNAKTFTAGYDQNYWPTFRAVSGLYNDAYSTDAAGNVTAAGGTDYAYDAIDRLSEEDSGSAAAYTYDATHNRLTRTYGGSTVTTTVPAGNNKISAVGANSYTYDALGNITDDGAREYVWDSLGHLKEVKISAATVGAYTYNAANQRTKKVAGGTTTHYVYGAGGLLYGEYNNSGVLIREYVYLNGAPLAQINGGSPETVTYLHTDHLGTPKFGTNAAGSQVWAWAPDAFGSGAPTGTATVNLRMSGQFYDTESGLFYNWNRYYNPETGRYISSDPIGLAGGINTFGYVGQNPVMRIDPMGLADSYLQCVANATAAGAAGGALLGACAAMITPGGQPFIGPAIGYGGEFGAYAGALTGMATCSMSDDESDKPKKPAIPGMTEDYSVEICKESCDAGYEAEKSLCQQMSIPKNRAICYSEASERYGQCLANCGKQK